MRVAKVRDGEKFVMDDRGGVWEKIGVAEEGQVKARCFFGPRDVYGSEVLVDPGAYCYVIFEDHPKPFGREAERKAECMDATTGIKVVIISETTNTPIYEIQTLSPNQLVALSTMETIRFSPKGKRQRRVFNISERAFDIENNVVYLIVMEEKSGEKNEEKNGYNRVEG